MKNKIALLFLIFLLTNSLFSQNLILNGGFEGGGSGLGFVTNGAGYRQLIAPYSGTTVTGDFAVTTNPSLINTASFIPSSDHTSGSGSMLVIDGTTTTGNPRFWKAGNTGAGVIGLVVGATYRFSYWIKSVSSLVTGPTTQADIGLQTNGSGLTLISGSTQAPLPQLGWRQVVYSFTATATTATIELWNNNTSAVGNDFAVDDFVLTKDLMVTYITDAPCASPNDGSILVSGLGGTLPYTNYTITGPVTLNNATGVFTGMPPGVYTVSVTDSAPTPATASFGNAVVGPSLTITPSSSAVCLGSSTALTATGSSSGYTWSAPLPTAGLPTIVAVPTITVIPTAAVAHTYTASSTIGACNVTKSVTIIVNQLPVVTNISSSTQTICPGNQATFVITGTPNSTVTLSNPTVNPLTTTVTIGTTGTVNFTTPVLNASVDYQLTKIKRFSTSCERNLIPLGLTLSVNVVPNGCATVGTIPAPGTQPLDLTLCSPGECRTLQANVSPVPSTTSYSVSSIPYCPQAPFNDISFNQFPLTSDDTYSPVFTLPFNFCFYGTNFNNVQIGDNGLISFGSTYTPNTFGQNAYVQNLPFSNPDFPNTGGQGADSPFRNMICGVFQDTDSSVTPPAGLTKSVNYSVIGQYPCRKLIVNFNLGQFSCGYTNGEQASQIVLYEISNIIEVYVKSRSSCDTHQGGRGTIGIKGGGINPPFEIARDSGDWDTTNEGWRFTPTGPPVPVVINWLEGATLIGTGATVTVCPTATTTYTANAVYNVCGVLQTATTSVELKVNTDITNTPSNITQCTTSTTNTFDLTSNTSRILSSVSNPADYVISYHLTAADAATRSFSITNPSAFVSSGQTIYAAIYSVVFGCSVVKPFELIISSCGAIAPVPDLTLCESSLGSGSAVFDLSPQTAIALSAVPNPTDYTITYYLTLANANAEVPGTEISTINAFVGTNQTIYIRMQSIVDPAIFYFTEFNLIVNPLPTIVQPLPPYILSDNGNDGYETFNLSSQNNIILGGQTGMSVTFYPSLANAQNNTNSINNTTSYINTSIYNQTLGIRVTNKATGCYNISTMDITVLSLGINDTEIVPLQFAPNPVKTNLELQSTIVLQSVIIYNVLGQKVYEKIINDTSAILDLSNLKTGSYLVKIDAETGQKIIRIAKE
jgi:hypothetical protein